MARDAYRQELEAQVYHSFGIDPFAMRTERLQLLVEADGLDIPVSPWMELDEIRELIQEKFDTYDDEEDDEDDVWDDEGNDTDDILDDEEDDYPTARNGYMLEIKD